MISIYSYIHIAEAQVATAVSKEQQLHESITAAEEQLRRVVVAEEEEEELHAREMSRERDVASASAAGSKVLA